MNNLWAPTDIDNSTLDCNDLSVSGNLLVTMPDSNQPTSRMGQQVFPRTRWSVVLAAKQQPSPEAEASGNLLLTMPDSNQSTSRTGQQVFPRTRWSVVLAAKQQPSPEAEAALETICRSYWFPLYGFVRRSGQSSHDAQDLTQEFFRHLLEKRWLDAVDRDKGRLRTFLVTALKHFMAKEWRRASARKRGGAQIQVPIDTAFAESRYAADDTSRLAPEAEYDRQWALTLLDLTVQRLESEFAAAGKGGDFAILKDCLVATHAAMDYRSIAARLEMSEGAARVAAHRMRKRFRELYREEIAQTLPNDAELDAELRYLAGIMARA
jgi:RNA polymerase sigma-70 factor (ECF subfamily)